MSSHMHNCSIDDDLHARGLRKTHPRHRIIELFHRPQLWSARGLGQELHDVGQTTIYRTLRLLVAEGVILPVKEKNGEESFERAAQDHHDHQVCNSCQVVECLPCPIPTIDNHALELQGTCTACAA